MTDNGNEDTDPGFDGVAKGLMEELEQALEEQGCDTSLIKSGAVRLALESLTFFTLTAVHNAERQLDRRIRKLEKHTYQIAEEVQRMKGNT